MNPLTNIKNIQKLNETELKLGVIGKKSWHDEYKDSAWVFIGGLPYDLSEGDIVCAFSQYGEIVNMNLVRDHKTGKSKGFAFLCFEDQRSTVLTVDNLNGTKILGRTIRVDHVKDYKVPKDHKDDDEMIMKMRNEGCAPKIESDEQPVQDSGDKVTENRKKKKKVKKEIKREKIKKESSSSSSSEENTNETAAHIKVKVEIKQEPKDSGYEHGSAAPLASVDRSGNRSMRFQSGDDRTRDRMEERTSNYSNDVRRNDMDESWSDAGNDRRPSEYSKGGRGKRDGHQEGWNRDRGRERQQDRHGESRRGYDKRDRSRSRSRSKDRGKVSDRRRDLDRDFGANRFNDSGRDRGKDSNNRRSRDRDMPRSRDRDSKRHRE